STFSVGEVSIPTSEIRLFTAFGNGKLNVSTKDASYFIQGDPRFNAIKYLLMFNRFMEKEDLYYGIYSDLLR
ncbi:MAG: hypothetical protein KBS83_06160, partial [Lachnospiraceae bacterium]|nr:hypothetical protein [Candidatus Equihabitans merdae]